MVTVLVLLKFVVLSIVFLSISIVELEITFDESVPEIYSVLVKNTGVVSFGIILDVSKFSEVYWLVDVLLFTKAEVMVLSNSFIEVVKLVDEVVYNLLVDNVEGDIEEVKMALLVDEVVELNCVD